MLRDLLLEIGVEEMPPPESPRLAKQLDSACQALFREHRIEHQALAVYYTPRRLALYAKGVNEAQRESVHEIRGPAKEAGLGPEGEPTQAARGFAKGHGVSLEDLVVKETPKGEYLYARKRVPGRPTAEVLPELLPRLIGALAPSETMRWDDSGLRFIRPIRWILCLFGEEPIPFKYGRVRSENVTSGHRILGERTIRVRNPSDYFERLRRAGVILDQLERRAMIEEGLKRISQEVRAHAVLSEELWGEIADNLEHPTPVVGSFPERYLRLPREVLETTLVVHQRFVPFVLGEKAAPSFVGFRDGPEDRDGTVRRGYERVVAARLEDSAFFFEEDRVRPLAVRVQELRDVIYQEQLGSIWDKVERMRKIAVKIADALGWSDRSEEIDRTVTLCKADLTTEMVGEFPDLEGVMGGIYARMDGEPKQVWRGIYEHYRPKGAGDALPEAATGVVASLADRIDTVIGSLLLGEEPTGSRDPLGLRRKANGGVRILLERELDLDLLGLIRSLEELYDFLPERQAIERACGFFKERLSRLLEDDHGIGRDAVQAVLATGEGNFFRALRKAQALEAIRGEERFQALVTAFTRVGNIVRDRKVHGYDPQGFQEEAERELWRAVLKAEGRIKQLKAQGDYPEIVERLISLRAPIDRYFDEILVMAEDPWVRQNRLGFLSAVKQLFCTIGDLSKIVVEGKESQETGTQNEPKRVGRPDRS